MHIANRWLGKRRPVGHDIVSEDSFTSERGERGHMLTCSCGKTIKVVEPQYPAAALRNLAYDQWGTHKRDTSSI